MKLSLHYKVDATFPSFSANLAEVVGQRDPGGNRGATFPGKQVRRGTMGDLDANGLRGSTTNIRTVGYVNRYLPKRK